MAEEHEAHGHGKKVLGLPPIAWIGAGGLLLLFVFLHKRAQGVGNAAPGPADNPSLAGGGSGESTAQSLQQQAEAQDLAFRGALRGLALQSAQLQLGQQQAMFASNPLAQQNLAGTAVGSAGGHTEYSYGIGAVSKAWQQVTVGGQQMWEDVFHPGHIISESQAQALGGQNSGPYAQGRGSFLQQLISRFTGQQPSQITAGSTLATFGADAIGAAAGGAPITLGTFGFQAPAHPAAGHTVSSAPPQQVASLPQFGQVSFPGYGSRF